MKPISYASALGGYLLKQYFSELKQAVNSTGGIYDQAFHYLDYESGENWWHVSEAFSGQADLPTTWIINTILSHLAEHSQLHQEKIAFIGLGSGNAKSEIRLINDLVDTKSMEVHFHMVDISHYLLSAAYQEAQQRLGQKGVHIQLHEGNFYHLHRLTHLFSESNLDPGSEPRTLRVGTLFGNTFANLTNELLFVQDSLSAFEKGDLLILHFSTLYAPATDKSEILRKDPRLAPYSKQEEWEHWLLGPIRRYRQNLNANVELHSFLEASSPVPGSYGIGIRAVFDGNPAMTLFRVRRYEEKGLVQAFAELGWRSLGGRSIGEALKKASILILEKT